jgi:hypothetical protein|tara:strand:- start:113 stop:322 length:210 start_codon:yes stop_codon:yes gene_type:complete
MKPVVLIACFTPIAAIWIVMKLAVFLSGIYSEEKYVESESRKPHGPYLADAYADVDEEEEEYGNRTDYR